MQERENTTPEFRWYSGWLRVDKSNEIIFDGVSIDPDTKKVLASAEVVFTPFNIKMSFGERNLRLYDFLSSLVSNRQEVSIHFCRARDQEEMTIVTKDENGTEQVTKFDGLDIYPEN